MEHADAGYLEAKRVIDDAALDRSIAMSFREALPDEPTVVDLGCGTGSMLGRLMEWGVDAGTYLGIDADDEVILTARELRTAEARELGAVVSSTDMGIEIGGVSARFECGDALERLQSVESPDAIIGLSFADLVEPTALLDAVEAVATPGTQLYLPITFDDLTIFTPTDTRDTTVIEAFHATMRREGFPDAGRRLISRLGGWSGRLEVASSDWLLQPGVKGYDRQQRLFLGHILGLIETAVPETAVAGAWLERRRLQLEADELGYIAHQYDLLYRF
jgi:SAM-dependent methyltransferase